MQGLSKIVLKSDWSIIARKTLVEADIIPSNRELLNDYPQPISPDKILCKFSEWNLRC